jgi:hypothetical protein
MERPSTAMSRGAVANRRASPSSASDRERGQIGTDVVAAPQHDHTELRLRFRIPRDGREPLHF